MPPSRSGIAAYSAELLPLLRQQHDIDVYVEDSADRAADSQTLGAHDFVWRQRRQPYDLTVYQLGNAACHGYMWAYLFNYPGVVVLHDAQLHQARALWLLTERLRPRRDDYLAEFRANEPDAPPEAAELIAAGLGQSALYQQWPFVRLAIRSARLTLVHSPRVADALRERFPVAPIAPIAMGVAEPQPRIARPDILARHGIAENAVIVVALGGVTPEKRLGPLMKAVAAVAARAPSLHLLIVGERADHYDAMREAERLQIADRVQLTGYVPEEEVASYVAAADICSCLRWPTNRETSASWLRCAAAGKATLVTALSHLADLPPIAIAIDVLDEDAALPSALETLAIDALQRSRLGGAARAWWAAHHRLEHMAADYDRALARAVASPIPSPPLPRHLRDDGTRRLCELAAPMGVSERFSDLLG